MAEISRNKATADEGKPPIVSGSSYPVSDNLKKVYEALGITYVDNEIGRAWCRLADAGLNCGPAIAKPYQTDDGYERQIFSYGRASRDLGEVNINRTVVFYDARGEVGRESGI